MNIKEKKSNHKDNINNIKLTEKHTEFNTNFNESNDLRTSRDILDVDEEIEDVNIKLRYDEDSLNEENVIIISDESISDKHEYNTVIPTTSEKKYKNNKKGDKTEVQNKDNIIKKQFTKDKTEDDINFIEISDDSTTFSNILDVEKHIEHVNIKLRYDKDSSNKENLINAPGESTSKKLENDTVISTKSKKKYKKRDKTGVQDKDNLNKKQFTGDKIDYNINFNDILSDESKTSSDSLNVKNQIDNIIRRFDENEEIFFSLPVVSISKKLEYNTVIPTKSAKKDEKKKKEGKTGKDIQKANKQVSLRLKYLQFEVKYLSLDEQVAEIDLKKYKCRHMNFICQLCGAGFLTKDYLQDHQIKHTEKSGHLECDLCHLRFKTKLVLIRHLVSHRRKFTCVLCKAQFSRRFSCKIHQQKCGPTNMRVTCEICNKVYSNKHSLKVHMKVHSPTLKHCCQFCNKKFKTKQRADIHERIHTGYKPFNCDQCQSSFKTHYELKLHLASHSARGEYHCNDCNTYFKTAKNLKRHVQTTLVHLRNKLAR